MARSPEYFKKTINRVALVYPVTGLLPPVGLITLGAVMESAGCQVIAVSMFEFGYEPGMEMSARALNRLREFAPDVIGISFMSAEWKPAKEVIERLRAARADAVIIAGGRHPSSFPEQVLGWGADFAVVGEGETAMEGFLEAFPGGYERLRNVEGLAFHDEGGSFHLKPREKETADLNVIPAYHLIPYQNFIDARTCITGRYLKAGCLSTSRGCFSRCIYCRDPNFGKHLRFRSMENIFDDIRLQLDNFSLDGFYVIDDMFAIKESRVIEFCDRFKGVQKEFRRKLFFAATARTDTLTMPMVLAMKSAGCAQLSIGVESGSQRILDFLGTGKKSDTVAPAFDMLRGTGIDTFVNFIFGVPGETEEDIQETMAIVKRIHPGTVSVTYLTPYPGTPLFDMAVENGWIAEGNFERLTFMHSHAAPHLETGMRRPLLESRKRRIYRMTFKHTLLNVLRRRESLDLARNILRALFRSPRQVARLTWLLATLNVDDFKKGLQLLLFSSAHTQDGNRSGA